MHKTIAVFGTSGAIGHALAEEALKHHDSCDLIAISRSPCKPLGVREGQSVSYLSGFDLISEEAVVSAVDAIFERGNPDLVLIATGVLHGEGVTPERRMRELDPDALSQMLAINLIGPAMILKHLLTRLPRKHSCRIGVLSARVGSTSDNRLGGWYSYRASKAGLNQLIKTAAIELGRSNPQAVLVGLHPGTVDSDLSAPFQASVPKGRLFSPDHSAHLLMDVLLSLKPSQSGLCFDWAGKEVAP
ncbi:NAD(P)-dependent dehydrogenase, short-chain alcohol dehydrogenase family [Cohaesibacter sp. ES.047]|uniref:SDR family NAD(P)-dependent oxidoreductase n=1 Tax=Cohaesibacter sp. ES.047 TaxID=1798205 RepID=UPI000BB96DA3|nr:SDR family NAD(P)-dependent oxidoreductase [Cohaesibacter sp. ES.047]SNY94237.1 NAD(P)-dependent dehydrogenase, short-chain alcohol dehydrogenase family [Cohaesibacter sp. ES.047]